MEKMVFDYPHFSNGLNTTIRLGPSWAAELKAEQVIALANTRQEVVATARVLSIKYKTLGELSLADILAQHNPYARSIEGVYNELHRLYGSDFTPLVKLTVIWFSIITKED